MNLTDCEEYLIESDFGITKKDIKKYNDSFDEACLFLKANKYIPHKRKYNDKDLLKYSEMTFKYLVDKRHPVALKIRYLLMEGFILWNCDGTISKNNEVVCIDVEE